MRLTLPSPYEEIPHTADAGIRAFGSDAREAFARAVLAMAQLQAGGGAVDSGDAAELVDITASGEDQAELLVDFARRVLERYYDRHELLGAVEIHELGNTRLKAHGWFAPFDSVRHGEGLDIKAVTYACAAVERLPDGRFSATLIFDI